MNSMNKNTLFVFGRILFVSLCSVVVPLVAGAQGTGVGDSVADKIYFQGSVDSKLPDASVYDIISTAMMWTLAVLGFIAIIGFVISGILYLTAAGNDTLIKQAKNAMWYSLLGVIVALMGAVVVFAVDAWLNAGDVTGI